MLDSKKLYETLCVENAATEKETRTAYMNINLSCKHHPDKGGGGDTFFKVSPVYDNVYDDIASDGMGDDDFSATITDAMSQYARYRSSSHLYPSYERLYFVRLPYKWIHSQNTNTTCKPLQYWPALLYKSYGELIKDLGEKCGPQIKAGFAKLQHEFRKEDVAVARFLHLNVPPAPSSSCCGNSDSPVYFTEPNLHIVQMHATLDELICHSENSSAKLDEIDKHNSSCLLPFYERLCEFEEWKLRWANLNGKQRTEEYIYEAQCENAVVMVYNCLALDVYGPPLREKYMGVLERRLEPAFDAVAATQIDSIPSPLSPGKDGSGKSSGGGIVVAGDSQSSDGGSMTLEAGDGPNQGGAVTISAGLCSHLVAITPGVSDDGSSGTASLKTPDAAGTSAGSLSGDLNLATGSTSTANSGDTSISDGLPTSASGGDIALTVGSSDTLGGSITLEACASCSAKAGDATFVASDSQSSDPDGPNQGGAVTISAGSGSAGLGSSIRGGIGPSSHTRNAAYRMTRQRVKEKKHRKKPIRMNTRSQSACLNRRAKRNNNFNKKKTPKQQGEKTKADFIDFSAGIRHYDSNNDPISQRLPCFDNDDSKTLISFVIENVADELLCTCCGELAPSPLKLDCCRTIICYRCAREAGSICPLKHCLKSIGKMEYCAQCHSIDDNIGALSIHCINGCGWYGCINAFSAHRRSHCFLESDEDRNIMDGCVVAQYDRCTLNNDIVKIASRVWQLQLSEHFDYVSRQASSKFRFQMQQLRQKTMEMLESTVTNVEKIDEEQKQKEQKAANDLIQKDARTLEELSNSVTTKTSGGGNHQTFDYHSWLKIHDMTEMYATALFGDILEEWHCVDIGAGILIGVISGSIASSKMFWTGVEICNHRLRLGAEICKLVETKWRKQSSSKRELKIGFLEADCSQPLNLRGTNVCLLWDRAFNDDVVEATFHSLARSYTMPFLLIVSNEKWHYRSKALLEDVFSDIQVVGITEHITFRGSSSGDSLIYVYVGSPRDNILAVLPPLDESSPSINDISSHRFGSGKIQIEIERFQSKYNASFQRGRNKNVP